VNSRSRVMVYLLAPEKYSIYDPLGYDYSILPKALEEIYRKEHG